MRQHQLEIDKDGAPVTLEPGSWFVYFVPSLQKRWWHPFVNKRHKHVFAMRPAGKDGWTLFEPWWHRPLTATITSEQARKFLLWGAQGDVLLVREAIPGHGSQLRGWTSCAALASYLLGRKYWVWTPHGLYNLLLREPGVCRAHVSVLLESDLASIAAPGTRVVAACPQCTPDAPPAARRAEAFLHGLRPGLESGLGRQGAGAEAGTGFMTAYDGAMQTGQEWNRRT